MVSMVANFGKMVQHKGPEAQSTIRTSMPTSPKEMGAAIARNLPAKTRKTYEQWVALTKKDGPPTRKERVAWLKSEHGIGTVTAFSPGRHRSHLEKNRRRITAVAENGLRRGKLVTVGQAIVPAAGFQPALDLRKLRPPEKRLHGR